MLLHRVVCTRLILQSFRDDVSSDLSSRVTGIYTAHSLAHSKKQTHQHPLPVSCSNQASCLSKGKSQRLRIDSHSTPAIAIKWNVRWWMESQCSVNVNDAKDPFTLISLTNSVYVHRLDWHITHFLASITSQCEQTFQRCNEQHRTCKIRNDQCE